MERRGERYRAEAVLDLQEQRLRSLSLSGSGGRLSVSYAGEFRPWPERIALKEDRSGRSLSLSLIATEPLAASRRRHALEPGARQPQRTAMRLSCLAPAKVNRELRVGGLRPDGYHEIRSRIVSIDLADRLTAEPADGLEFSCDDPAVPAGEDNLVVRAARLLAARRESRPAPASAWRRASPWEAVWAAAAPTRPRRSSCSRGSGGLARRSGRAGRWRPSSGATCRSS